MVKEKALFDFVTNELRQSIYYVPRNYQTIGGMWTVDTYRYDDITLQIMEEGWFLKIVSLNFIASERSDHFEIEKGTIKDLEQLMNKLSYGRLSLNKKPIL